MRQIDGDIRFYSVVLAQIHKSVLPHRGLAAYRQARFLRDNPFIRLKIMLP